MTEKEMDTICTTHYNIYFNNYAPMVQEVLSGNYSKIFILCDTNTHQHCVYSFLEKVPFNAEIIEMEAGEEHKNIETCIQVWEALSESGCDRHSLLINIGGGVVTDLGGMVASLYQRGIAYMNLPTSLLAMVDASVGGKTGIDLRHLKNQIGLISQPKCVLIDTQMLQTLPHRALRAGLAEMIKHGIVADQAYFAQLQNLHRMGAESLQELIHRSVVIKNSIVEQDPQEKHLRKVLNYGHTLGHAIESYCLNSPKSHIQPLLHGEAIAMGMIMESYLSYLQGKIPLELCESIKELIGNYFEPINYFDEDDTAQIIRLIKHDKKAKAGEVGFVLIADLAKPLIDERVSQEDIAKAFEYYYTQ